MPPLTTCKCLNLGYIRQPSRDVPHNTLVQRVDAVYQLILRFTHTFRALRTSSEHAVDGHRGRTTCHTTGTLPRPIRST